LGRRSNGLWKPILLVAGCLVGAAWIVQAPGRPVLGLIGLMPIVIVALAIDVFGLRSRLPLLRSQKPIRAIGGWAVVGTVLLASVFFALSSGLGQASPTAHQASAASPPSAASAAGPQAQAAAPPAVAPAPVSSAPAAPAPPVSTPAKPSAPAASVVNPAANLLASVLAAVDPTLAADLGIRDRDMRVACPRSSRGDGGRMSLMSGAANGAAAMLQCNHGGSR
jgi:hypothetical protein